jgi:hypothetical protein
MFSVLRAADSPPTLLVGAILGTSKVVAVKAVPPDDIINATRNNYHKDPHLSGIIRQLEEGGDATPPGATASSFFMQGDILFHDSVVTGPQMCVPVGKALDLLLHTAHDANGHAGVDKTIGALRGFYISFMRPTVQRYINSCPECQRSKHLRQRPPGLIHPLPYSLGVFKHTSVDICSGLPDSRGFDAILVVTCLGTKAILAIPIRKDNCGAERIADLLLERVVGYFGPIINIHSDRGPQFVAEVFQRIFAAFGTNLTHTTAFHPAGDGATENANRTLLELLRASLAAGVDGEWVDILPLLIYALNSTPSKALGGISPLEAMMRREPMQLLDLANPARREIFSPRAPASGPEVTEDDIRRGFDQALHQAMSQAKAAYKLHGDARRRPAPDFKPGDRVLVSRIALSTDNDRELASMLGRKLSPLFVGPFAVKRVERGRCELDLPPSMRAHPVISVQHLRPFVSDSSFGRPDEPPPVMLEGEIAYQPEFVKGYEKRKVGGRVQHCYWIKFLGFTDTHNKWLTTSELRLCRQLLIDFWAAKGQSPPRGAIPSP